jgi:hypothetical protein
MKKRAGRSGMTRLPDLATVRKLAPDLLAESFTIDVAPSDVFAGSGGIALTGG